jgi:hypothetical protein
MVAAGLDATKSAAVEFLFLSLLIVLMPVRNPTIAIIESQIDSREINEIWIPNKTCKGHTRKLLCSLVSLNFCRSTFYYEDISMLVHMMMTAKQRHAISNLSN